MQRFSTSEKRRDVLNLNVFLHLQEEFSQCAVSNKTLFSPARFCSTLAVSILERLPVKSLFYPTFLIS
jgi:hypothetical protein